MSETPEPRIDAPEPTTGLDGATAPSPRAFCHATGVVFQFAGVFLILSICCGWGFAGSVVGPRPTVAVDDTPGAADAETARNWASGAVWINVAGGLGALAAGIGLHHDRRRSGLLGMATAGASTVYFGCYLVYGVFNPAAGRLVVAGVMLLVWGILFLLAGHSAEILKRHPPPPDRPWTPRDEDDLRRRASLRRPDRTNR